MQTEIFLNVKKKYKIGRADLLAYLLVGIFICIFTLLSFGRHDALKSYLNDIGTYDQVIWNTLQGNFFQITTSMYDENNFLAGHFSPILLFFVPFYAILASPKWLLFFQALAVGIGGVPIYLFAKEKLKNSCFAFIFLGAYLFYPFLMNGTLYDFHEVVFATVFASGAFYFLEKGKDKWFVFFSILLAMSQEHLSLLVFMMGLYAFFIQKRRKFGFFVSSASIIYFFLIIGVVMPYLSHTGRPALLESNSQYGNRYDWLGSSIPEIVKNITIHPIEICKIIFSFDRLKYLSMIVIPAFSLALFSWPILIPVPLIAINLLSNNSMTFSVFFYHSAIMAPFVFFAAIETFKRWFLGNLFLEKMFLALIVFTSIVSGIIWGVTPLSTHYKLTDYIPDAHAKNIKNVQRIIPADAEISVQHNLGPHFSQREKLYRFPIKYNEAEYVLLDTTDPYRDNPKQLFDFPYALQINPDDWKTKIAELKKSPDYSLIYDVDGYLVFKKNN